MTRRLPRSPAKQALIVRYEGGMRIEPPDRAVINALTTTQHWPGRYPSGAFGVAKVPKGLAQENMLGYDRVLNCRATMEQVVRHVLARKGYTIRRSGLTNSRWPAPVPDASDPLAARDPALLAFVQDYEWGLIRYIAESPDPVDRPWLIAQIARAWPDKTMAVVVRRLDEVKVMAKCLQQIGVSVTMSSSKHWPDSGPQVVVTTPIGLVEAPADIAWLDVVIVADARLVTIERFGFCVMQAIRSRLYGLLPLEDRVSPLEQDRIRALFGFNEVYIPLHGWQERMVHTLWLPIAGGMPLPEEVEGVRLRRRGIWHHAVRNRRLAQLARAFAQGDRVRIERMLGHLDGIEVSDRTNVLLVAANVEQALALGRLLPDWGIAVEDEFYEDGLSPEDIARLQPAPTELNPFVLRPVRGIVTAAALRGGTLLDVDVLVRADGGTDVPPVNPAALLERQDRPVRPLLLVDCVDRQHPSLRRESWQREKTYTAWSWLPPDGDAVQARVEQYLARRGRRRR